MPVYGARPVNVDASRVAENCRSRARCSALSEGLALARRTGQSGRVEVRFSRRPDGIIDAAVGPNLDLFSHALVDAVSSRAPRGAVWQGLSTYWIDRAEEGVRLAAQEGDVKPFAAGNITCLRVEGDRVLANLDFDSEDDEADSMPISEFLNLLTEWRQQVVEAGGAHGPAAALGTNAEVPRPMGPAT